MWSDDDEYFSYSPYYFGSNDDDDSGDDHYFDDDDYYYSSGEDCSGLVLRSNVVVVDDDSEASVEAASTPSFNVAPLQDLCCRFISRRFPFAFIEHRSPPIPDELQLKIIQFSFPEDEKMIQKYAEFSRSSVDFCSAKRMLENGNVKDMNQIGFRLSASVEDRIRCSSRSSDSGKYYVTIHFDRGKITSAHCSCELSTNWCSHVIATCLARIKNKNSVTIHLPVSDSLNLLDREQLLKFAQYLLCEHQNEPVVETAQQLLDKLLSRQQQDQHEDINMIAGAPDPTAGPGLDEEAHWFVSKSGFKSRCDSLMYESQTDLGFVMYNDMDNDRGNSVNELWEKNCLQQALVRDEMDLKLDNEYHGYSTSRHQSVLHVLETIADLLQDDFMSAVSALTMCTEQLIERLNKLCRVNSPADMRYRLAHRGTRSGPKEALVLCGSLAGGFTPRVSSCRTLSDELARLWRLAVLRPGIAAKQHQGVVDQLRTLNQTAFVTGTLRPWQGLEVAIRLSSINWDADDLQRVLRGEWVRLPVVSSCMSVQLTCQSKTQYVSEWMAMEERQRNDNAAEAQSESTVTLSFNNPHCISFGPHFDTDIHSVCSMIEALNVNGNYLRAMRLTVALSCALVSFYKNVLLEVCDVTSMPVSARCSLGAVQKILPKPGESGGESPMEVETPHGRANNVWPEDTILSVTTFAFLFELLSQKPDWAESCLVEMRSKLSPEETLHDCVKSVNSLKFHVGVLGLFLQRLPAPSLHHEVEEYNYECWLTYQLICSSPADTDLAFLTHLGQQVISTARPFPPSSLSRVIFHHLFKGAPAALSKSLTERQSVGLGVAFHVLGHVNEYTIKETSSSWMLFQYANCRLWAKLAEVVLRSLSDSHELLERAMGSILQPNGMLGAQSLEDMPVDTTPVMVLSRLRDVEFITAKCRVACCLAKSLSEKQGNSIKMLQYKKESGNRVTRRESFEMEMPRKIMKSGVEKALKLCAVQIAAHSLWLQKLADRSRVHGDTVRWLTEFVVSSGLDTVRCLVNCKGDVTSFFAQTELLDLCEKVLRKEEQVHAVSSLGQDIVQGILLSLLHKASQSETSDDMKRIVSFCRDKRCATKVDLLPWICKGLQSLADSNAFLPFEVLMDASHGMLEHYKEKLATAESLNRVLWNQKGTMYLNRLFNDGVQADEDSDNENGDSVSANRNPYRTPEPHPFLQTAFDLGMMGLEKLKQKPDELLNGKYPYYRRCPVKEHLSEFCRLVCYLVNKRWMTEASPGSPGSPIEVKSPNKAEDTPSAANAMPGCSYWEDAKSQNDSLVSSVDSFYLHKFVCSLITSVENPLWLFEVLQELGDHLSTEVIRSSPISRQERQDLKIKEACQSYPSVKLLLQRDLDEFSKLLLGPGMSTVIEEVVHRRDRRRLEPSEIMYELGHCQLMNTRLKDVLKTAKRAFSISDSSGSLFKHLTDEITSQYSILHSLVDGILKEKELSSSDERELGMFPRASILPALFAQGLFPGLFERSYVDDYF